MKRIIKYLSLILSVMTVITVAFACTKQDNQGNKEYSGKITEDVVCHRIEGMLHERKVSKSNKEFVKADKTTDYSVIYDGDDKFSLAAASFITNHVFAATGAKLNDIKYSGQKYNASAKYIVIGVNELFVNAGLSMPDVDLGSAGYYIKTKDNSVFIMSKGTEGFQMGAIAFLEELIGYDMIADDFAIYEKDGKKLPDIDIKEKPDYEFRDLSAVFSSAGQYGMGYTNNRIMIPINGLKWHNSFALLEPKTYYGSHKAWYSDTVNAYVDYKTQNVGQLCYTAHGNFVEYTQMVNTVVEKLKVLSDENPSLGCVSITEQDNYEWCECEQGCKKLINEYGTNSATCIKFLNDVSERLTQYLEPLGRRLILYFFAYHGTEDAPATKTASGEYKANVGKDGKPILCHKNVGVIYAPIIANYSRSMYDPENAEYAEKMKGWRAVCDNMGLWIYQTNFKNYLYPFNSWDITAENLRFGKENNAVYIFNQGQMDQDEQTAFSKLKEYLTAKLSINVNLNQQELIDKFFKYYFGEGGVYMYEMFNDIRLHLSTLYQKYPSEVKGYIYENISSYNFWAKNQLEGYLTLIDKAYNAIIEVRATNPELYQKLKDHICLESIFPRFALCSLFGDSYKEGELLEMRKAFKADADYFRFDREYETKGNLNSIYANWGIL